MSGAEAVGPHGEQELAAVGDVLICTGLAVHANTDASVGGFAAL